MTTDNRITSLTQLENKSFQLQIERIPSTIYFCTSAPLPGVTVNPIIQPSPFSNIKVHGDRIIFQPLVATFVVDEDLQNFQEIFNWMVGYSHPTDYDEYKDSSVPDTKQLYSSKKTDATLLIPNNKYIANKKVMFEDVQPIDLSDLLFDVQIDDISVQICTVTFEYTKYSFVN